MANLFPSLCVDNFFDDPHKIIEISNKIKFERVSKVSGVRSPPLHIIHPKLFEYVNQKIIKYIYPGMENPEFQVTTHFQKSDPDQNDGWVHRDEGWVTAIIYLTPGGTVGTSLWDPKEEFHIPISHNKHKYFKNKKSYSKVDKKLIYNEKIVNNSHYNKTIHYEGKFNRMICFSANNPHCTEVLEKGKNRLTLISFIYYIRTKIFPINSNNLFEC
jgi:hypothetical protein